MTDPTAPPQAALRRHLELPSLRNRLSIHLLLFDYSHSFKYSAKKAKKTYKSASVVQSASDGEGLANREPGSSSDDSDFVTSRTPRGVESGQARREDAEQTERLVFPLAVYLCSLTVFPRSSSTPKTGGKSIQLLNKLREQSLRKRSVESSGSEPHQSARHRSTRKRKRSVRFNSFSAVVSNAFIQ